MRCKPIALLLCALTLCLAAGSAGAGKERTWSEAISILLNIMNMANRISVPAEACGFVSPWNR